MKEVIWNLRMKIAVIFGWIVILLIWAFLDIYHFILGIEECELTVFSYAYPIDWWWSVLQTPGNIVNKKIDTPSLSCHLREQSMYIPPFCIEFIFRNDINFNIKWFYSRLSGSRGKIQTDERILCTTNCSWEKKKCQAKCPNLWGITYPPVLTLQSLSYPFDWIDGDQFYPCNIDIYLWNSSFKMCEIWGNLNW